MNSRLLLIIPMLCLLLTSCSSRDEYAVERAYYQLQKQAAEVLANPEATPPMELERVVGELRSFVTRYPGTKASIDAQFSIARLYVATKNFPKAHEELTSIYTIYAKSEAISAEAVYMRGLAYEVEGDWDAALKQFRVLSGTYPETLRGLEAPFHIAMWYKQKYQPDKMMQALREAVAHYKSLAFTAPRSSLALKNRLLIAQCYAELNEWELAAHTLQGIVDDFKGQVWTDGIMFEIANIYAKQLKDPASAKVYLNRITKEFPGGRASNAARAMLAQLEKDSK
jgi:TolA-binding protein